MGSPQIRIIKPDPELPDLSKLGPRLASIFETEIKKLSVLGNAPEATETAETIHEMRVGIRKMRSYLRAFREPLGPLDPAIAEELRYWGAELGHLRDLDVLIKRLKSEGRGYRQLVEFLGLQREPIRNQVRELLATKFKPFLGNLNLVSTRFESLATPIEAEIAKATNLVRRQAVRKSKELTLTSPSLAYHEARKRTKRVRYLVELAPESKARDKVLKGLKRLQDEFGARQDCANLDQHLLATRDLLPLAAAKQAEKLGLRVERREIKARKRVLRRLPALRGKSWRSLSSELN